MTNRILRLPLLAMLAAALLVAENNSSTAPTTAQIVANLVSRLTTLLDLTTAQQTQATTIFTTEQTALATIHTTLETEETALQTAILKNDQTGINAAATQIGSLTTQEIMARGAAEAAFYAILTTDQQTKFATLKLAGFFGGLGDFGYGPGPGRGGPH
jgi:Spy/CpxP family protein refolding chaperone